MSHFETKDNKQMSHEMSIKLKPKQQEAFSSMSKRESIFLTGPAGTGKCLGLNTPIIMFDGSIKMVQDVKPNDLIMGDDSTSRRILNIASGQDEMYKIMTRCGDSYIVNSAHILTFVSIKHFRSKKVFLLENKRKKRRHFYPFFLIYLYLITYKKIKIGLNIFMEFIQVLNFQKKILK
jgi:hypothetical protein